MSPGGIFSTWSSAQGQAVISGTTLGGYSYDDPERRNGVFTAALLDGLRGGASVDARSFVTVRTLTDFVNERVLAWVRDHRSEDASLSRGITRHLEGAVAEMPLAFDASQLDADEAYGQRRAAALDRLRRNLETPLTGAMFDEMNAFLGNADPSPERLELIVEIEALDGSERMRRALESYWRTRRRVLATRPPDTANPSGDERPVISGPSPAAISKPSPFKDPVLGIDFVPIERWQLVQRRPPLPVSVPLQGSSQQRRFVCRLSSRADSTLSAFALPLPRRQEREGRSELSGQAAEPGPIRP